MGHKCQHLPWIKYVEILGMAFFEIFECFAKRLVLNQKWHSISYFRLFKAPGRIVTFLVGNPHKPSFATVTGWGLDPRYHSEYSRSWFTNVC